MRHPTALLALIFATPSAVAQTTWFVDPGGTGDFTSIAAAVAAASSGDSILVLPGEDLGGPITIDGKGLTIAASTLGPHVLPHIEVRNIPAQDVVLLRNLRIASSGTLPAVRARACAGRIRIEGSALWGYAGLDVEQCTDVTVVRSEIVGADPNDLLPTPATAAIVARDALVIVDRSQVRGVDGSPSMNGGLFCLFEPGDGTSAVLALDGAIVWVSGGTVRGGFAGLLEQFCTPADSGPAFFAGPGSRIVERETSVVGNQVQAGGQIVHNVGPVRSVEIGASVASGTTISLRAEGAPGDTAFAFMSNRLGTRYLGDVIGAYQAPNVVPGGRIFLGTIDGTGVLETDLPANVVTGSGVETTYVQLAVVDVLGDVLLAPVQSTLVFGPDVPIVLGGTTVRVDTSAASGGNGSSWGLAYDNLRAPLARVWPADELPVTFWLRAGNHRPGLPGQQNAIFNVLPGTRVLGGFQGTELSEAERDPAANLTWIDGDLLGNDGPQLTTRQDNAQQLLYAVGTEAEPVLLSGLRFRGSNSVNRASASLQNSVTIEDCVFTDNLSVRPLDLRTSEVTTGSHSEFPELRVRNCRIEGNHGGALSASAGSETTISLSGLLVHGNISNRSVVTVRAVRGVIRMAQATIAQNRVGRGAIDTFSQTLASTGMGVFIENSVVWGNVDGGAHDYAAQFIHFGHTGPESIRTSLVEGYIGDPNATGTTALDPLFVNPLGPDGFPGTLDEDLRLTAGSPGVDSGNNSAVPAEHAVDLDGRPRIADDPQTPNTGTGSAPFVDRGAYER